MELINTPNMDHKYNKDQRQKNKKKQKKHTKKTPIEDIPLVEFMYLVFRHMPGES